MIIVILNVPSIYISCNEGNALLKGAYRPESTYEYNLHSRQNGAILMGFRRNIFISKCVSPTSPFSLFLIRPKKLRYFRWWFFFSSNRVSTSRIFPEELETIFWKRVFCNKITLIPLGLVLYLCNHMKICVSYPTML